METRLLGFIQTLRQHQLNVSSAESLDAMRALALLGYHNKPRLKQGLALVLAKTQPDKNTFEHCFDLFFSGDRLLPDHQTETAQAHRAAEQANEQLAAQSAEFAETLSSPLSQLLLDDNPLKVPAAIASAAAQSDLDSMRYFTQKGQFGRRILLQLGVDALLPELQQLQTDPRLPAQQLYRQLQARQLQLREQVSRYVEEQFLLTGNSEGRKLQEKALRDARLSTLEQRHFDELRALVRKLAKKLAARHSRRPRVERSGRLDVAKTLRKNIRHDSILFETHWRRKRKQPAQIFVLCDVSGSVSAYAKFLLLFLYSLHDVLPRIRSFCFSNRLGEVTDLFNEHDVAEALDEAMRRHGMGGSDYGRSLLDFEQQCLPDLGSNSTVIILGDARNNQADPRLDTLRTIYQHSKRLIWLNPESRSSWGSGDSEMLRYQSACHHVFQCQTLQQLERFIDQLLKQSR